MLFDFFKRKKEKVEEPTKEEKPVKKAEAEPQAEPVTEEKPQEEQTEEEQSDDEKSERKPNGNYFVSPHPDGGWQVKKANAQRALKRFETKAEAEKYAKQVANNQGTNVVRQKKDGKIQKKH
jgi:hypothetical protein